MNIHTHLIPGMIWLRNHLPNISTSPEDLPSLIFNSSALLCLFASAIWHTMYGCAHHAGMLMSSRMDWVGIGLLISASMGTVTHYGLYCHEALRASFLSLCVASAVLGTIFPFMDWFEKVEYRVNVTTACLMFRSGLIGSLQLYQVAFFLGLASSAAAPLACMAYLYGFWETVSFISERRSSPHPIRLSQHPPL